MLVIMINVLKNILLVDKKTTKKSLPINIRDNT